MQQAIQQILGVDLEDGGDRGYTSISPKDSTNPKVDPIQGDVTRKDYVDIGTGGDAPIINISKDSNPKAKAPVNIGDGDGRDGNDSRGDSKDALQIPP